MKVLLLSIAVYFVFIKLTKLEIHEVTKAFTSIGSVDGMVFISIVVLLQFVNYGLEMLKWKETLPHSRENLRGIQLLKAVYVGTSFAFVTPNRLGGFVGRFLVITQVDKIVITLSTFYGNFIQMTVTMFAGSLAIILSYYSDTVAVPVWMKSSGFIFIIITLVFVWMIFNMNIWLKLIQKLKWNFLLAYKEKWNFISKYDSLTSLKMLFWGSSRYFIFCLQLYLLFMIFNIELTVNDFFIFIGTLYLFTTFIPSVIASNVGTREAVALFLLSELNVDAQIVISTLFLWLINMVLPAFIGWVLLWKITPPKET